MSTSIQSYEGPGTSISQWRDPEQVLEHAKKAAVALKAVLDLKPKDKKVIFNGEEYLEREDWGTVSRFFNCTAKAVETRYVQFGDVAGWEAVAVVIDLGTGVEVGRAESMTLNDEDNWGMVPVYEWQDELDANGNKIWVPTGKDGKKRPKGKRVQVGSKAKPLFQLRSMAQTRAEAKALKSVFGWVVVLAGYQPTPAEEMTGHEFDDGHEDPPPPPPPIDPPQSNKTQAPKSWDVEGLIEGVQAAPSGKVYLTLKNVTPALVSVSKDKFDQEMQPGVFIKFHAFALQNAQLGKYWELVSVHELSQVQEGEAPAEEQKMAADAAQVAKEMFPDSPEVQGMVDSGALRPASQIEKKTIGSKRAQRLYAIANQNKDRNNGFNEEAIKDILGVLPIPLQHLSDLDPGMYEQFEKWAEGKESWKAWLDSD